MEIKSFLGKSIVADVQAALGQFIMYREVLADKEPDRALFLAVEEEVFYSNFSEAIRDLLLQRLGLKIIVFNEPREEVLEWLA